MVHEDAAQGNWFSTWSGYFNRCRLVFLFQHISVDLVLFLFPND